MFILVLQFFGLILAGLAIYATMYSRMTFLLKIFLTVLIAGLAYQMLGVRLSL